MKYKVVLEHSNEGIAVSVPGLPGCHSQGANEEEALEKILPMLFLNIWKLWKLL